MSIIDAFDDYFEIIPADTEQLKREVYQLRYQVYCVEKGFLPSATEGLEYDDYDAHSSHYLIRHRESGCYMATTRLILPNRGLFPIEIHSQIDNIPLVKNIPRANLAELSRFCVSKQFRRRANEKNLLITNDLDAGLLARREKGSFAHLTLALFTCAIKMSHEHNIQYWYAIMDSPTKKIASTLGIHFIEIGAAVDYYGVMRKPYAIKLSNLLRDVAEKNLDYWTMLTQHGQ